MWLPVLLFVCMHTWFRCLSIFSFPLFLSESWGGFLALGLWPHNTFKKGVRTHTLH